MSDDKVRELLQKLATDDSFRARFENDPSGVLGEYGVAFDPQRLPGKVTLPAKDEIAKNADAMAQHVTSTMGIILFKV